MIEVISRKVDEEARVYEITFRADNNEQIKQIRNFMYTLSDQSKTNADHIRSMTDAQMARAAAKASPHCPPGVRATPKRCAENACTDCWLEHLKQPYKEGVEC